MILDKFPAPEDFYKTYWNKQPFIIRKAISQDEFKNFIDGDTLAGLSLEEDIKSRIVTTSDKGWSCEHGPFEEERFSTLGEENWSLLVQNIDQYHQDTANLLKYFSFAPLWLMDDIMVSYSAIGGTVGAHTDSYHVFLVQGKGKRNWKISNEPILNGKHQANQDLKVLENGFDGQSFDVTMGDVIYIPPHFGHEGKTIEEAMTLSVGFLCPKLSEMLIEYGSYLEETEHEDARFEGQNIDAQSANLNIADNAINSARNSLINSLQSPSFDEWMVKYFSTPTHDDIDNIEMRENQISEEDMITELENGKLLYRKKHIKMALTSSSKGIASLAVYGTIVPTPIQQKLLTLLNQNKTISLKEINDDAIQLVTQLYNMNALSFRQ